VTTAVPWSIGLSSSLLLFPSSKVSTVGILFVFSGTPFLRSFVIYLMSRGPDVLCHWIKHLVHVSCMVICIAQEGAGFSTIIQQVLDLVGVMYNAVLSECL